MAALNYPGGRSNVDAVLNCSIGELHRMDRRFYIQ